MKTERIEKRIPSKIGKYPIHGKLGEGGMSSVYKATHPGLERFVIIKELDKPEGEQAEKRFRREARIMMDLRHENIVQVHDYLTENRTSYIVMEYVNGISLEQLLEKKGSIPQEEAALIIREVARALKHAHDRGIVHRDIKPGNIMISRKGEVKLMDFGIASSREDADAGLTVCGMTLGTPAYMSPEQLTSTRDVDKRADIYSLGITLYEMVCGRKPFAGGFTPETVSAIQSGKYDRPRKINQQLQPRFNRLIRKSMHRKCGRRFRDLTQLIRKLNRGLHGCRTGAAAAEKIRLFTWNESGRKTEDTPETVTGKSYRWKTAGAAAAALLVTAGLIFGQKSGTFTELFRSETHGALQLEVRVPSRLSGKKPRQMYISAVLKKRIRKNDRIIPVLLRPVLKKKTKPGTYTVFRSRKMYLPAGSYSVRVEAEHACFQNSFHLEPREVQRKTGVTGEKMLLRFTAGPGPRQPVLIYYTIKDSISGNRITGATDFYIYYFGWRKWRNFLRMPQSKTLLTSGKTYLFKFEARGYYPEIRRLHAKRFQNSLRMTVNMVPKPGTISISSEQAGLDILINNSRRYISGGRFRKYTVIPRTSGTKPRVLTLNPGSYYLTIRKSGEITETRKITILPGKKLRIHIAGNGKQENFSLAMNTGE